VSGAESVGQQVIGRNAYVSGNADPFTDAVSDLGLICSSRCRPAESQAAAADDETARSVVTVHATVTSRPDTARSRCYSGACRHAASALFFPRRQATVRKHVRKQPYGYVRFPYALMGAVHFQPPMVACAHYHLLG
jgi:hypothetical protein